MPTVLKHELEQKGFDEIPENLRPIYQAVEGEEGKYAIPENLRGVADAISGLFGANTKIRAENDELKKRPKDVVDLSPLSEYGETVESIVEAIQVKLAAAKTEGGESYEQQLAKDRQEMKKAHDKEIEGKDKSIDAMRKAVHQHLVVSKAVEALNAENGNAELALPFVTKHLKVIEEDGSFTAVVVDADGDPRISGGTGSRMTVTELVKEMKGNETYAPLFKSESKGGGGIQPSTPASVPPNAEKSSISKISDGLKSIGSGAA